MPYRIEWYPDGVYKRFTGHVTAAEFMRSIADLQSSPQFEMVRYSVNDFTAVEKHDITESDVVRFAAHAIGASRTNANIRIALVVQPGELMPLVQTYANVVAHRFNLQVFQSVSLALDWVHQQTQPV